MGFKEVLLIEWADKCIYVYWCWRCREMTEICEANEELRCTKCNYKMATKADPEWIAMLRENGKLQ